MAERFMLVTSEPLLKELSEVLARPRIARHIQLTQSEIAALIESMRITGEIVPLTGTLNLCRDPKDDMVLETAVAGHADALVSGDKDITDDPTVVDALADLGIRVLVPAQFVLELDDTTL